MYKKYLILSAFLLALIPGVSLAVGNGSITFNGSSGPFTSASVTVVHDTSLGTLDSTGIVVWNSAGTVQQWAASSSLNGTNAAAYFFANGTYNLKDIGPAAGLSPGNYRMAAVSLFHGCCTAAQMETLWNTESNANTNSAGYYYPVNFTISAGTAITSDCTGGTITHSGGKTIHTFNSSSSLVCAGDVSANVLAVGGGGSGGYGGGGAGGFVTSTVTIGATSTVTIGLGGAKQAINQQGVNGGNTTFPGILAYGGGGGGTNTVGKDGGSGGGGAEDGASTKVGGNPVAGQGNKGGDSTVASLSFGGGGGATTAGQDAQSNAGGQGGDPATSTISGAAVCYAAGGPGASNGGAGRTGNCGAGSTVTNADGTDATANTGSGGGGGSNNGVGHAGGAGASGIVIVSYTTPGAATTAVCRIKAIGRCH